MLERILMAGSGGQGIVLAGKLFAGAAVSQIPHVTFFPSYGAEVRGGTSHCQIILSSDEISSPVSRRFDSMLLMNEPSMLHFLPCLEQGGIAVINSSLCGVPNRKGTVPVDATRMADRLGDVRAANLIMLGAYLARRPLLKPEAVESGIADALKTPGLVELNIKAFRAGLATP